MDPPQDSQAGAAATTSVVGRPRAPYVYKLPAPIRTFPVPYFDPKNPICYFQLAYTWLKQVFFPPPAEPSVIHIGFWDFDTRSVHVEDEDSIRALWEQGFYGKGSQSRSEPNWLKRELARRGASGGKTVIEARTEARREERRQAKWERAKAELEAREQQIQAEAREQQRQAEARAKASKSSSLPMEPVIGQPRPPVGPAELLALPNSLASATGPKPIFPSDLFATHAPLTPSKRSAGDDEVLVEAKDYQPPKRQKSVRFSPEVEPEETTPAQPTEIINREIFQLSREEAFFLQFSLGALKVVDRGGVPIPTQRLLDLFRASSRFPPSANLQPDDPFLIDYTVYHHFRSLGWVPRHGIKFGVDWLLYQRGPAFDHSEFGIVVMPAYTNKLWDEHEHQTPKRSWSWLMGVNRVLSHVLKSLVLVYVDIPPPPVFDEAMKQGGIAAALKNYKVREVMVRRFSVNRNRESK